MLIKKQHFGPFSPLNSAPCTVGSAAHLLSQGSNEPQVQFTLQQFLEIPSEVFQAMWLPNSKKHHLPYLNRYVHDREGGGEYLCSKPLGHSQVQGLRRAGCSNQELMQLFQRPSCGIKGPFLFSCTPGWCWCMEELQGVVCRSSFPHIFLLQCGKTSLQVQLSDEKIR